MVSGDSKRYILLTVLLLTILVPACCFMFIAVACKIHEVIRMAVSGKLLVMFTEIVAEQSCHRMYIATLFNKALCYDGRVL